MNTHSATYSWAADEVGTAHFGDARLTDRAVTVLATLADQPHASVPHACNGSWAATKALYRFWANPRVTPAALRAPHLAATRARAATYDTVLAIQDTTNLDFTHHPATTGLGYLDQPQARGLKVHSVLAATGQGVPLGLLHQHVWTRPLGQPAQAPQRRQRRTAAKESGRWLTALAATQRGLPRRTQVITVADSEADIYDLFAARRPAHSQLLVRATHNRAIVEEAGYLWDAVRAAPLAGTQVVSVGRRAGQPAREATVSLRYTSVTLKPPRHHLDRAHLRPVRVQAVLVEEIAPPAEVEGVCWLLLTTLAVPERAAAQECTRWYSYRWLIERYHFVLKSGCRIEELQLATAERLERALATYCIVAWRLLWLTYEARRAAEATPCSVALTQSEWQALYCTIQQVRTPAATAPSLREAVRWIAQLGGFLSRAGDGEPGAATIWRGWVRLQDIVATWRLLQEAPG